MLQLCWEETPVQNISMKSFSFGENWLESHSQGNPICKCYIHLFWFLSDPGKPGVRSLGPDVTNKQTETPFVDLTDVTPADEDTN